MPILIVLSAFALLSPGPASATQDHDSACVNERGQAQVDACTRVIGGGYWRGRDLAWAYGNRGGAYLGLNQLEPAIADLSRSIELDESPNVLDNRGLARIRQNDYAAAVQDFDRSLRLRPRAVFALRHRAVAYSFLDNPERAIRDLDAALQIDNRDSALWNDRGYILLLEGRYEEAVENLSRAIELNPQELRAWANRGEAKLKLGDISGANADYARHQQLADSQSSD